MIVCFDKKKKKKNYPKHELAYVRMGELDLGTLSWLKCGEHMCRFEGTEALQFPTTVEFRF